MYDLDHKTKNILLLEYSKNTYPAVSSVAQRELSFSSMHNKLPRYTDRIWQLSCAHTHALRNLKDHPCIHMYLHVISNYGRQSELLWGMACTTKKDPCKRIRRLGREVNAYSNVLSLDKHEVQNPRRVIELYIGTPSTYGK